MTSIEELDQKEIRRIHEIDELEPTKNRELMDIWDLEDGSEVHQYLKNHLDPFYFRGENKLIRLTDRGNNVVGKSDYSLEQPVSEGGSVIAQDSETDVSGIVDDIKEHIE